jgi:hypothetical protein
MSEVWRWVPRYRGLYEVSNTGRVRGIKRGRILNQGISSAGYLIVGLSKNNKRKTTLVHRIVLEAFTTRRKKPVNHKDGNKLNNRVDNLEYTTPKKNQIHAVEKGLIRSGEKSHRSILTEKQVISIVTKESCSSNASLGRKYGVHESNISKIRRGLSWKRVTKNYI